MRRKKTYQISQNVEKDVLKKEEKYGKTKKKGEREKKEEDGYKKWFKRRKR